MLLPDEDTVSVRPPSLLALPSYLAGSVAILGNRPLVALLKPHRLGLAQYAVMVALHDFGELAPHELATRLATDRSHVSAYVETLVGRGWVVRVPDTADRRRVSVGLTDEGRELVGRLVHAAAESQRSFLDPLSEAEQHTLRALLTRIMVSAQSTDAPTPDQEQPDRA